MKLSYLYISLISVVYISCGIKINKFSPESLGKYESWDAIFPESIAILTDTSFICYWNASPDKYDGQTIGQIKFNNGKYLLSNQNEYIAIDSTINSEGINIKVVDKYYQYPIIGAKCNSYNKGKLVEGAISEMNGSCTLYNTNIDNIKIELVGYSSIEIPIYHKNTHSYVVKISEPHMTKLFTNNLVKFKDDELRVKNKKSWIRYNRTPGGNNR